MTYNVSFGSAFEVDQFGFVRGGQITVEGGKVIFTGNKGWPVIAKVGVFLFLTIVPLLLFRFGLGCLLALVIIHYFCASKGSLSVEQASLTDVRRNGRQIKFQGQHPESGKRKKTIFKVDTEENAVGLERELQAMAQLSPV